ncbi:MAG: response regulator [Candidatus Gastranaerophilales bacterium]|nr:response regulator [Candidatus Gastranaerophilales bacterium]
MKILYAEDDKDIQFIVKTSFEMNKNHELILCNNGKELLDIIINTTPDLILMDVMMPEMDGLTAYKKLTEEYNKEIPVIFLTATAQQNEIEEFGKKPNVLGIITKPFDPLTLIEKIEILLKEKKVAVSKNEEFSDKMLSLQEKFLKELKQQLKEHQKKSEIISITKEYNAEYINDLYGWVHQKAGTSGIIGLNQISEIFTDFEKFLLQLKKNASFIFIKGNFVVINDFFKKIESILDNIQVKEIGNLKTKKNNPGKLKQTPTVLIVDDEDVVRDFLKEILEDLNFKILAEAKNGNEAIEILQKNSPDIILLDLNMPFKGGVDVIKEISAYSRNTCIMVVTISCDTKTVGKCITNGAHYFLRKDLSTEELKTSIFKNWQLFKNDKMIGKYNEEFCKILLKNNVITSDLLDRLHNQYNNNSFSVLLELLNTYNMDRNTLGQYWGDSISIAYLNLKKVSINRNLLQKIPYGFLKENMLIPVYKLGNAITIASANPKSSFIKEYIENHLSEKVNLVFSFPDEIHENLKIKI